jgi:hypothetical protein
LRETVKNIETQDPLDVPPKYTNRPDFQCNELLCDQDKAKPGQDKKKPGLDVVKIAGGVLVLQDPCIKFLTQAEVEPKVAKTTAAQPASVVSPQPEQISDVNSDACQAAETINLPGARVDELNANERFLRQLDAK